MIARGFKPVAWVAAVGSAALGCYMLSLQVAAERAQLAALEGRILETRRDIRALQTELGTRGRLSQLEQWNAEVLALSAPAAHQFLESNLSLVRFDHGRPTLPATTDVRLASADGAPPAPPPAPSPPAVRLAVAEIPAPSAPGTLALRRAGLEAASAAVRPVAVTNPPPAPRTRPAAPPAVSVARAAPPSAAPPRGLLDSATLADLRAQSRSEREGGTAN